MSIVASEVVLSAVDEKARSYSGVVYVGTFKGVKPLTAPVSKRKRVGNSGLLLDVYRIEAVAGGYLKFYAPFSANVLKNL